MNPSFEDLSEVIPQEKLPWILRDDAHQIQRNVSLSLCRRNNLQTFNENGFVVINNFSDEEYIEEYCHRFINDRGAKPSPVANGRWRHDVPYMEIEEIRNLCLDSALMDLMRLIIGHEMGLHLNLLNWTSTERNWHQDDYLNPDYINNHYLAVWFALEDIHPDSGPFECIPGSHKWPLLRRHKVFAHATPEMKSNPRFNSDWPTLTEEFVTPAVEAKIRESGIEPFQFLAKKGDILIWSGSLMHRGSTPKIRGMERRSIIAHYSSIDHRLDMPYRSTHSSGGTYFVL